jgi:hypothetical protein
LCQGGGGQRQQDQDSRIHTPGRCT